MSGIFAGWNEGELSSYLVEITTGILARVEDETRSPPPRSDPRRGGAEGNRQVDRHRFADARRAGDRHHRGGVRARLGLVRRLPQRAACRHEKLVAFGCKRRGFCPSCGARRMAETAAHLVEHVLSQQPIRQWVLSFPYPLRFLFATRPAVLTQVLGIVYRPVSTFL